MRTPAIPRPKQLVTRWWSLPRRTVRLRLTILYAVLFVLCGAFVLAITYLLTARVLPPQIADVPKKCQLPQIPPPAPAPGSTSQDRAALQAANARLNAQRDEVLHKLLLESGIALGAMTVVSVGVGWVLAGRALRPVRAMTSAARR